MSRINSFLELAVKQGASDLHLVSGQMPRIRINGVLHSIRFRELSLRDLELILDEFLTPEARKHLERDRAADFAYSVEGMGRFRVNAYWHCAGLALVMRVIPSRILSIAELGLPPAVESLLAQRKGMTLVTGPTGSGKSNTLAAMIHAINGSRKGHIITIEDPIEFIHEYRSCVVTQREVGVHAKSFSDALRDAIREDPDVIMVGEMRDVETIGLALTAAETGIQVFGTLHTNGAVRCIDRIINVFPARRQEQVRVMLAESLRLVVSQQLVRLTDGGGRVAVCDILVNTTAAASTIRSGQSHRLTSVIQAGGRSGMQSMDAVLADLVRQGKITGVDAYEHAIERGRFERYVSLEAAA